MAMNKTLDNLIWEVYAPGIRMEDFMAPNQHLPERQYPCKDCKQTFATAEEFSSHFERDGFNIIGCKGGGKIATIDRITN